MSTSMLEVNILRIEQLMDAINDYSSRAEIRKEELSGLYKKIIKDASAFERQTINENIQEMLKEYPRAAKQVGGMIGA